MGFGSMQGGWRSLCLQTGAELKPASFLDLNQNQMLEASKHPLLSA